MPDVSSKLEHGHRCARPAPTLTSHGEAELGGKSMRRFVLAIVEVGRDVIGIGTVPEIIDRGAHRLRRNPVVASVLRDPPARFDLVGSDSVNSTAGQPQLRSSKESVVSTVTDRPRAKAVLFPLDRSGLGVA